MKKAIAIASIVGFALSATPAFAFFSFGSSSDINVSNTNNASVSNNVNTSSKTGYNSTYGGSATGGDANGGSAFVVTGNAAAAASVENLVNKNYTSITKNCGCKGDVNVSNNSNASVSNTVKTSAKTGSNDTSGGSATANNGGGFWWWHGGNNSGTATGGDAVVGTGDAVSASEIVNIVNKNVTRIQ